MKAHVTFDTLYGNTERIARALETGLREAGIESVRKDPRIVDQLRRQAAFGEPTR